MSKLRAKMKKEGGFTLVEMLIVVAIIAILIAIAIPMVNTTLERAREATDSANERAALGLAMSEVMTVNKLAGQVCASDDATTAYYLITGTSKMGTLVPPTDDHDTVEDGACYGKGTQIGDIPDINSGKTIMVTYDPTQTDEKEIYKVTWMPVTP